MNHFGLSWVLGNIYLVATCVQFCVIRVRNSTVKLLHYGHRASHFSILYVSTTDLIFAHYSFISSCWNVYDLVS